VTGSPGLPSTPLTQAALDELGQLLLADQDTQSVLQRIVDLVAQVMPEGAESSVTLLRGQRAMTAAATGELARYLDERQYERGHGPCLDAALGGQLIEITDGRTDDRWPGYLPTFLASGARSALAVPVPAATFAAGLNVYAPVAGAFTDQHRHAVAELAAHAAVALTNMVALQDARDLAGNLRAAMESRAAIEQAKGLLMERHKVSPDGAFRLLADVSMRTHRKVRDLAEELVLTGRLGP